jgi:hypothetical protein
MLAPVWSKGLGRASPKLMRLVKINAEQTPKKKLYILARKIFRQILSQAVLFAQHIRFLLITIEEGQVGFGLGLPNN